MIPYGKQSIDQTDVDAVVRVLCSPLLTQGEVVPRFENLVARRSGAQYGVAVNSATSALHIACLAVGLAKGDLLWTVPNTFVASANAGRYCGADVDFVDINPRTYVMDVDKLEIKLIEAKSIGRLPNVVIPVHFAGQSCDMERIGALSRVFGFHVIEDASHAVGATYQSKNVGNCQYSDIAVFSFHPVKIVTTGEGGMCLTNDPLLADSMRLLRSHGISRDPSVYGRPSDGPWDYRQTTLGFNFRMTEVQAALGESQFARLDDFLTRRREIAARYDELLSDIPVICPWQHSDTGSSWHLYVIQVDPAKRRKIFEFMQAQGIGVQVLYIPVHRQPYYEALGFRASDYPCAEEYYRCSFTLPIFPLLSSDEQDWIVDILADGLRQVV